MKSYDLVNWEMVNYVYDRMEDDDKRALKSGQNDYACGSWASSIRYDEEVDRYFVSFSCESTNKTYVYNTANLETGPWIKSTFDRKLYDGSMYYEWDNGEYKRYYLYAKDTPLLGDDGERVKNSDGNDIYVKEVHRVEMELDKTSYTLTLGEDIVLMKHGNLQDPPEGLTAEGYHAYHIGDYYYLIMIQGCGGQRQEIIWRKPTLDGDDIPGLEPAGDPAADPYGCTYVRNGWEGKLIMAGDICVDGDENNKILPFTGIAQGGIIEGLDGNWYSFLFQDTGAVGRTPVLMPMRWESGWPVLGNEGRSVNYIYPVPETSNSITGGYISDDEFDNGDTVHYYDNDAATYNENNITAGISIDELERLSASGSENMITDGDFSSGTGSWFCRGGASYAREDGSLKVTNRTAFWEGAMRNVDLIPGGCYRVSAKVKYDDAAGGAVRTFNITLRGEVDGAENTMIVAHSDIECGGGWVTISGDFTVPETYAAGTAAIFVENPWPGYEGVDDATKDPDYYLDDAVLIHDALAERVAENEYGYNGSNLNLAWQWNHNPNNNLWSLTEREGWLRLKSGLIANNIQTARNTLTQRTFGPISTGTTLMDTTGLNEGDFAGLSSFQNQYGFVGVTVENGKKYVVMRRATKKDDADGIEVERAPLAQDEIYLKIDCDFTNKTDKAYFFYSYDGEEWYKIGDTLQMAYDWPHFVGQRFGLFYYSTKVNGGHADFDYFRLGDTLTTASGSAAPTAQPSNDPLISLSFNGSLDAEGEGKAEAAGDITYADGKHGKAASLSADSKNYIKLTKKDGTPLLSGVNECTISFWSKASSNPSWWFYAAPSDGRQPLEGGETYLGILDNTSHATVERYNKGRSGTANCDYDADEWKHIAVIITEDQTKLYINGSLKSTASYDTSLSELLGSSSVAYIGMARWSDWAGGEFTTGLIDDFKIYGKAFTSDEVKTLDDFSEYAEKEPSHIMRVEGEGIKTDSVVIAPESVKIPVIPGTDIENLQPEFTLDDRGTAELASGTYAKGTIKVTLSDTGESYTYAVETYAAGNPIIDGAFGQPDIISADGKYYVYATAENLSGAYETGTIGVRRDELVCLSSEDMLTWKNEGVIFTSDNAVWSSEKNVNAPCVVEKDGVYYMYYALGDDIGLAYSASAKGGFVDTGAALIEGASEPYVLSDGGKAYIYYTKDGKLYVSELESNMTALTGSETEITPDGYTDGVSVINDNGAYYMIFSSGSEYSKDYTTKYASMASPTAKPVVKGELLSSGDKTIYGAGNASVINVGGKNYIAYQRWYYNKKVEDMYVTPNKEVSYHVLCLDELNIENGAMSASATADGVTEAVVNKTGSFEIVSAELSGGTLSYKLNDTISTAGDKRYTAVYDAEGRLLKVSSTAEGSVDVAPDKEYTVKAFLWDNKMNPITETASRTVNKQYAAESISLASDEKIAVGETAQLSCRVIPVNTADKSLKWTVSDPALADISDNGYITAKGAGKITVTAALRIDEAVSASAEVELYDRAAMSIYTADYAKDLGGGKTYMTVYAPSDGLYDVNIKLESALPVAVTFNDDSSTRVITESGSDITLGGVYLTEGENTVTITGNFFKQGENLSDTVWVSGDAKLKSVGITRTGDADFRLLSYVTDGSEHHGVSRIYVGNSLHLALSADGGKTYYPVNSGMGVLSHETDFEEAGIVPEKATDCDGNPWECGYDKCMTDANVFRAGNGYGVIATRTGSSGKGNKMYLLDSDRMDGCVELYLTDDLSVYDFKGYLKVSDSKVYDPTCEYVNGKYAISFSDTENGSERYTVTASAEDFTTDTQNVKGVSAASGGAAFSRPEPNGIGNSAKGTGVISITKDEYKAIGNTLNTAYNTEAKELDTVTIKAGEDLSRALPKRAAQLYSDGGTQDFNVVWDTSSIDTSVPGTYFVTGKQIVPDYDSDLVQRRADPSMFLYNDKYYFIGTWDVDTQTNCHISEADSIDEMSNAKDNIIARSGTGQFWAPELHVIGGKLSVLGSKAFDGHTWMYSHIMQLKDGGDPTDINDWSVPAPILTKDGKDLGGFTLDMTHLEWQGKDYYIWPICSGASDYPNDNDTEGAGDRGHDGLSDDFTWISDICIAEFDPADPTRLTSDIVTIARPNYAFERANTQVDEGPFALVHDGKVYVTIATNEVGDGYGIKLLTLKDGADPLDADSWIEGQRPLLTRANYWPETGPGHSSFTKNKDGDDILVYHWKGHLWGIERSSSCRLIHYNAKGEPVLNVIDFLAGKNSNAMVKVVVERADNSAGF